MLVVDSRELHIVLFVFLFVLSGFSLQQELKRPVITLKGLNLSKSGVVESLNRYENVPPNYSHHLCLRYCVVVVQCSVTL